MAGNTVEKKKKVCKVTCRGLYRRNARCGDPSRPFSSTIVNSESSVREFRDAFRMIDQDVDGYIDKDDLQDIFVALGKAPSDDYLEGMLNETPGGLSSLQRLFYYLLKS
eukprot:Seg1091.22 transcript_id=Seg1091.22/GoldUCD/mRNA.D3Y31 product="Myosin regulatory light polypeptide 9" protein_id=Seg1091.22/GoldUCD/D3Y31